MNMTRLDKGMGLVEIVIAVFIISASFFAVVQLNVLALKAVADRNDKAYALTLAQEGMEGVRNLRDGSWTNHIAPLTFGATYYLITSSGQWALTTSNPGLINGKYTRTVAVASVARDANDDITSSGGTDDPKTKLVTVTVSWGAPSKSVKLSGYMSDIFKN